jgi:hypothetical protein
LDKDHPYRKILSTANQLRLTFTIVSIFPSLPDYRPDLYLCHSSVVDLNGSSPLNMLSNYVPMSYISDTMGVTSL